MNKKKNILKTVLIAIGYLILAVSSSNNSQKTKENKKQLTYRDTIPQAQRDFFNIINEYDSLFKTAKNTLQKGVLADNKAKAIEKLFSEKEFQNMTVSKWRGEVIEVMSINGDAGLKIQCRLDTDENNSVFFYLTSKALLEEDNLLGKGVVKKSSPMFNKIAALSRSNKIEFSGVFYRSVFSNRFLYSNTPLDDLEQEYLFKVTDLRVLHLK